MDLLTSSQRVASGFSKPCRLLLGFLALFASATVAWGGSAKSEWKDIEQLMQTTVDRARTEGTTEQDTFNFLNLLNFRLEAFIAKYPADPYRWDAELVRLPVAAQLAEANHQPVDWAAQQAGYAAVLAAPNASSGTKISAQAELFTVRLTRLGGTTDIAALRVLAQDVEIYYDHHRSVVRVAQSAYDVAKAVIPSDPARAESILRKIADEGDGELPEKAHSLLQVVKGRNTPLELAFTAQDGRKVDLAALRGKVVLIDFWATWCPPCREEVPGIVETYRQLHDQGFEIVGLSLDEDRGKLRSFVQQHRMAWPQFYDGAGWGNKYVRRFGIHAIPAMWLVDKRGFLVDVEGRDDLEGKVKRLLAE